MIYFRHGEDKAIRSGTSARADVLIGGGGFAGLALAIALRQGLGDSFTVTVADPALGKSHAGDARASAIAAAARRLFETLGVWDEVADEAQPILDMVVTDSKLQDAMRPTFLTFGGEVAPGEPFAHMIENPALVAALVERAKADGVELARRRGGGFRGRRAIASTCASPTATTIRARLLVAADGARSAIREAAGIRSVGWDYDQAGIVTTVAHERDHHGRAEEHFLPAGPFAILPLKGKRSSIVWTEEKREAERIVALPDDGFHAELEQRFGLQARRDRSGRAAPRLSARPVDGALVHRASGSRWSATPRMSSIRSPGRGSISACAMSRRWRKRSSMPRGSASIPAAPDVLERYQRWRRFDTVAMGVATDGLNRLFSNRSDALRLVRDVGLGLVDRVPALKGLFIREAAGLTGDVPKLLRGEAL